MNLDMGELRNRLRSRTGPKEPGPEPEPDPEPEPNPVVSTAKEVSPVSGPALGMLLPTNMMGELKSKMEKRRSLILQEEAVAVAEAERSPSQVDNKQKSPADPKKNPFLGELNSLLKTRKTPDGEPHKPKIGPKPKLPAPDGSKTEPSFAKPKTSPKPESKVSSSSDILSNKPVSPNTSPTNFEGTEIQQDVSTTSTCTAQNEVPSTESKGSFFDELKKKFATSPSTKIAEKNKSKDEDVVDKNVANEEKENVIPILTHDVAKHRLRVRPKKTHRLSYAEFRKSRLLIQESLLKEEGDPEDEHLTPVIETVKNEDVPKPTVLPELFRDDSIEKLDCVDAGGVSDLESPGYSSADASEDQSFRTPPESPSCSSEFGQNESSTSDFYSVSSVPLSPCDGDFPGMEDLSIATTFDLEPASSEHILENDIFISLKAETSSESEKNTNISSSEVEIKSSNTVSSFEMDLENEKHISKKDVASSEAEKITNSKSAEVDEKLSATEDLFTLEKNTLFQRTEVWGDFFPTSQSELSFETSNTELEGSQTSPLTPISASMMAAFKEGLRDFSLSNLDPDKSLTLEHVGPGFSDIDQFSSSSPKSEEGTEMSPAIPPCRKVRAAKLKLKHEIEMFEKKQLESLNTIDSETVIDCSSSSASVTPGSQEQTDGKVMPENGKSTAEFFAAAKTSSPKEESVHISQESDQKAEKEAGCISSESVNSLCAELSCKTSDIQVQSGFITEEVEDFVVVDVTKELQMDQ